MVQKRIRDAIYGIVEISEREMEIINTPAFQRLRYIRQLATTYMVYPGAEHTRFGHSIGVMHIASRVIQSLKSKRPDVFFKEKAQYEIHWAWMEQMLRLMALTHDLGHPPFSHAGEGLLPDNRDHEYYTRMIVLETEIGGIINKIGQEFLDQHKEIDECFSVAERPKDITAESVIDLYTGKNLYKDYEHILNFLMDSDLDCDKMDYLLRDSHYCGVRYGQFDLERLLASLVVGESVDDESVKRVVIRRDGVHAFEEFVLARYFMFLQVYYHKTRRILDISLCDYIRAKNKNGYPKTVRGYLKWTDNKVLEMLHRDAEKHLTKTEEDLNTPQAKPLLAAHIFSTRTFPRVVFQTNAHTDPNSSDDYKRAKASLKRRFPDIHIIEDDPSKLPHQLPSAVLDGEKAVYVIKEDGKTANIMSVSYILNTITSKIQIFRMYVDYDIHKQARDHLDSRTILF